MTPTLSRAFRSNHNDSNGTEKNGDPVPDSEQLDAIADQINNRPRKGLGVRSPLAVYRELLLNSPQHSTLVH